MVTPIDIDTNINDCSSSSTTTTPTCCSNCIQNTTIPDFDYEPRLPQTNLITNDDIQRMRIIRNEAMVREDTNYYSSSSSSSSSTQLLLQDDK